jgi:hypothetical protein
MGAFHLEYPSVGENDPLAAKNWKMGETGISGEMIGFASSRWVGDRPASPSNPFLARKRRPRPSKRDPIARIVPNWLRSEHRLSVRGRPRTRPRAGWSRIGFVPSVTSRLEAAPATTPAIWVRSERHFEARDRLGARTGAGWTRIGFVPSVAGACPLGCEISKINPTPSGKSSLSRSFQGDATFFIRIRS